MSTLNVYDMSGAQVGTADWPEALLVRGRGQQAVHEAVVAHQQTLRAGTAATKNKALVAGSRAKPWRQKGTGRARAGYQQSPIWRGGGVVFGPMPRDYAKHLPRKIARLAFRTALSSRIDAGEVRVLETLSIAAPKTKQLAAVAKALGLAGGALVIADKPDHNLLLAVRNLPDLELAFAADVSTYQLLRWPAVVVTRAALDALKARAGSGEGKTA